MSIDMDGFTASLYIQIVRTWGSIAQEGREGKQERKTTRNQQNTVLGLALKRNHSLSYNRHYHASGTILVIGANGFIGTLTVAKPLKGQE